MFMKKGMLAVVVVIISFVTKSVSYGNYYREMQDYYDMYQRSSLPNARKESNVRSSTGNFNLRMPGVHPEKHDSYICTALELEQDKSDYIVAFKPHAKMNIAHHMLLFGCPDPAEMSFSKQGKSWNCGDMGSGVCRGAGEKILYAWGRNAPVLALPPDVAFNVGGETGIHYLVLQVHYGKIDPFKANPGLRDYSGVDFKTSPERTRYLAAIELLASGGSIPGGERAWHLDNGCTYQDGPVLHPFAFRVHAHTLGTVITGYRIRGGKWTLIGKGDPQRPQAFYKVEQSKNITISPGDSLAARCTYNSTLRDDITYIGATMKDEMCNFYMMYSYDPTESMYQPSEYLCSPLDERSLQFPYDSDVPLPDDGTKMQMKRNLAEEEQCEPPWCRRTYQPSSLLIEDKDWVLNKPYLFDEEPVSTRIGQVTAVDIDLQGYVIIFHRASRRWTRESFDSKNVFTNQNEAIPEATILKMDPKSGQVVDGWGENMFFMPHGLTIDHEGNTWLTDVALHQVFKFAPGSKEGPTLTWGKKFEPGNDFGHFCKPTDVAVDSTGSVYISDGYCNSRVVVVPSDGSEVWQIDNLKLQGIVPSFFRIPHSLSLDERNQQLFVADRENGRVLVFRPKSGKLLNELKDFGSRVFAVHVHSKQNGGVLHVVNGPADDSQPKGFTFSLDSRSVIQEWAPVEGFLEPHDVASDSTGMAVYVTDIGKDTVWKFKK